MSAWGLASMLILGYVVSLSMKGPVLGMIRSAGFVRPNYRGQDIPVSAGLVFTLPVLPVALVAMALGIVPPREASAFLVFCLGFGYLGVVDDTMGSRERSGLKGHLMALVREGKLTTGALKAIYGAGLSLAVSYVLGGGAVTVLLRAVVMALCANLINLLDLRPGRAIKGYLLVLAVTVAALLIGGGKFGPEWLTQASLFGAVLAYAGTDLKAGAMMGDTGSNLLGAAGGLAVAYAGFGLGPGWLWGWFAVLVLVHAYAEKRSITKTIEGNRLLKALDDLGRGGS